MSRQMPTYLNENGCPHYRRSCLVICNRCNRTYPCHICHNNMESHHLNRLDITRVLCLHCGSIQGKTAMCMMCKHSLSEYFCEVCCIWACRANIFHCKKCGLCRHGSPELFEHCDRCEACIEKTDVCHNHVSGGMKNNCPICAESMFDSNKQTVLLRCGHSLHEECYFENIKSSIHCPLCFRLVGDDKEIRNQIKVMMAENVYEISVEGGAESQISCFECGSICTTAQPSLFNACERCGSYNTKIKNDT
eukprot:jgi/Antlo1/2308/185